MSIIAINVQTTGLVGQTVNPRRCSMVTTDSLSTITTAGYLNNQNANGSPIYLTDIFEVIYSYNTATKSGTLGFFQVSYSSSTGFSLVQWINSGNVSLTGINTMASGSEIIFAKGTATTTTGAATVNQQSGVLTTPALTTAAGSAYVITLTNSLIATTSVLLTSLMGGTNTVESISVVGISGSGTATITLNNIGPTAALNGTVIVGFTVL